MIRDVGDVVPLKLTVNPSAGDTEATLTVTAPDGTTSTPTPTANGDRSEWSATLLVDQPGEWFARWTVSGTGAGREHLSILVRPDPGVVLDGRVYATSTDLANYTQAAPPAGSRVLLRRASELVDELLLGALYDTDDEQLPTEQRIADAMRDAVCAQVVYWGEVGDDNGTGAPSRWSDVAIGSVKLSAKATGSGGTVGKYAPATVRYLRDVGLLAVTPMSW